MSKAVKKSPEHEFKFAQNHKTIYADHIMRFAFGPVVSKLDFGISHDMGDQLPEISTTVIKYFFEFLLSLFLIIISKESFLNARTW